MHYEDFFDPPEGAESSANRQTLHNAGDKAVDDDHEGEDDDDDEGDITDDDEDAEVEWSQKELFKDEAEEMFV